MIHFHWWRYISGEYRECRFCGIVEDTDGIGYPNIGEALKQHEVAE